MRSVLCVIDLSKSRVVASQRASVCIIKILRRHCLFQEFQHAHRCGHSPRPERAPARPRYSANRASTRSLPHSRFARAGSVSAGSRQSTASLRSQPAAALLGTERLIDSCIILNFSTLWRKSTAALRAAVAGLFSSWASPAAIVPSCAKLLAFLSAALHVAQSFASVHMISLQEARSAASPKTGFRRRRAGFQRPDVNAAGIEQDLYFARTPREPASRGESPDCRRTSSHAALPASRRKCDGSPSLTTPLS